MDTQTFTVDVAAADVAPLITTSAPATGKVGEAYIYDADASGTTPLAWAQLTGPVEFTIDPNEPTSKNEGITFQFNSADELGEISTDPVNSPKGKGMHPFYDE